MKILKTSILLFITVFFAGCEDYLEQEPIGKLSSDVYLENEAQVRKALVGVYDIIQTNYSAGTWNSVYFIKNLPADDCLAAGGGPTDQSEYQYLDDFVITSDNAKLEAIWSDFYKTINASNTIVTQVGEKPDATDGMKVMAAEAKALRAFTYFDLVVMWGGVPLFTENPADPSEYHMPRASVADVYAQIEQDLKDAIAVLPLKSGLSGGDKFRFSKGTAQALLGKVYLYQEKYQEAADILSTVINSGEYSLEENFGDVWSSTTEFGAESLFEVSYVSNQYDWGNFPWGGGQESNIEAQLQGPRTTPFDLSESTLDVINGWGFNNPSREIGDLFVAEGETVRYEGTLISEDDFIATGGVITNPDEHDYEGYMRLKYVTRPSETDTDAIAELNYTINWRILRYADVLLMAAEAYNKTGQDGLAQTELEKVRARAGFDEDITATGNALFQMIVKERQLELAFEGQRYWDLVRWGLAEEELSDIGFQANKHELFPIPQNEIIANNAIDESEQNTGY